MENAAVTGNGIPKPPTDGNGVAGNGAGLAENPAKQKTRRNRRAASEDFSFDQQEYPSFPPAHISYPPPPPKQSNSSGSLPPNPGHHRVSSWTEQRQMPPLGAPYMAPPYGYGVPPVPPGAPGFFAAVNPMVPHMMDPAMAAAAAAGFQGPPPGAGGQYTRSGRKRPDHRRVHSYSGGGIPGYGSMFDGPPGPTSGQPQSQSGGVGFSPRGEFRKLGAYVSTSQRNLSPRPPASPMPPASPRVAPGTNMSYSDPRMPSFSPAPPSLESSARGMTPRVYTGLEGLSPMVPPIAPLTASTHSNFGAGGEAVFLHNKKKHRKGQSSRKMHMRQQSAQLYMEDVKGTEQLPACRDLIWLMIFVFHLLGIVYLGKTYGYEALRYHDQLDDESSVTIIYSNVIFVSMLSGVVAVTISALALLLMAVLAKKIVQIALILTITLSFAWGTIGVGLSPRKVVPVTGVIALLLSVAYSFIVWDRIPFAAANLNAAFHGIRANPGVVYIAFAFQFLALGWSIYFAYVSVGVYDAIQVGDIDVTPEMKAVIYSLLVVSYYWTLHVFLNTVQVTVAGVIGAWWFTSDGDVSSRKSDLTVAFFRAIFYAVGSICYGSLIVGPVRLLRQLSAFFRPSEEGSSLMCLHECLFCVQKCMSSCVDNVSDRFNPWAFTYVGLYGYGLVDGGLHATELFEKRGWTTIVSDDLVPNVLLMTSAVIGGITGCVAHVIENYESLSLTSLGEPLATSFVVGALVAMVVSSVLFGIISSSVNAVIVCFAASPVDFEQNHPHLSQEMRAAWREVWPGCMDVLDMRMAVATYLDPSMSGSEQQPLLA